VPLKKRKGGKKKKDDTNSYLGKRRVLYSSRKKIGAGVYRKTDSTLHSQAEKKEGNGFVVERLFG